VRLVIFYWCKCYDVILAIHTALTNIFILLARFFSRDLEVTANI